MTYPSQDLPSEDYPATVVNGLYTIVTQARPFNRLITQISIIGPAGSTLTIFTAGNQKFDSTPRGDLNTADYGDGRLLPKNAQLTLQWSVGTGTPVPAATFYFKRY